MSNIRRQGDEPPKPQSMLKKYPYGRPYQTTETRRFVESIQLPDGRIATRCDETVTEATGVEKDEPTEIVFQKRRGTAHSVLAALVAFFLMSFAYDSLSQPTDHPLTIFLYWVGAWFIWLVLK